MKKVLLFACLVALTAGVYAQDTKDAELGVTFDLTYTSRWMSKGSPAYGKQGAWFEGVDIDWFGTGFGTKVIHRSATAAGYVNKQRFDYRPYYKFVLGEGEVWQINSNISSGYEHYYDTALEDYTTWESIGAFSFPNIIGNGFVPKYIVHYETPAWEDYNNSGVSGWVHRFGFDYNFKLDDMPDLPWKLSSEIGYYDGLANKDDWAYWNIGLSTAVKLADNIKLVPGVYHQVSMEEKVCAEKSLTYAMTSLKIEF